MVNNTIFGVTATAEQKMTTIKKFLKQKKTSALMAINSLKVFEKPRLDCDDQSEPKLDRWVRELQLSLCLPNTPALNLTSGSQVGVCWVASNCTS